MTIYSFNGKMNTFNLVIEKNICILENIAEKRKRYNLNLREYIEMMVVTDVYFGKLSKLLFNYGMNKQLKNCFMNCLKLLELIYKNIKFSDAFRMSAVSK